MCVCVCVCQSTCCSSTRALRSAHSARGSSRSVRSERIPSHMLLHGRDRGDTAASLRLGGLLLKKNRWSVVTEPGGAARSVTLLRPSLGRSGDSAVRHRVEPQATWLRQQSAQGHRAWMGPPVRELAAWSMSPSPSDHPHPSLTPHSPSLTPHSHRNLTPTCCPLLHAVVVEYLK